MIKLLGIAIGDLCSRAVTGVASRRRGWNRTYVPGGRVVVRYRFSIVRIVTGTGVGVSALVDGDRDAPRGQPRPQEPAAQGWRRGRTSNEPGDLPTSERSRQSERGRRIARSSVHGGGDDCSLAPDRFDRCGAVLATTNPYDVP